MSYLISLDKVSPSLLYYRRRSEEEVDLSGFNGLGAKKGKLKKGFKRVPEPKTTLDKVRRADAEYAAAKKNETPLTIKGVKIQFLGKAVKELDPHFLKAMYIDWMSDPMHAADVKSMAQFCQIYRCPPILVKEWSKDKDTQQEIRKTVRELFGGGERIKKLYDRLWEQADKGIISAIRLALELTGEYTPKLQHLDKPKNLEDMLNEMEKADKAEKAGVFPNALRLPDESPDKPSLH